MAELVEIILAFIKAMEFAMMNLRKAILLLTLFFVSFGPVKISWTAVIFETTFDNIADWNTSGQYGIAHIKIQS